MVEHQRRTRYRAEIVRSGKHGPFLITREAVENMAGQLRNGAVPTNFEHDPTQPPIGRTLNPRGVERPDGELSLEAETELFDDDVTALILPLTDVENAVRDLPEVRAEPAELQLNTDRRCFTESDIDELAETARRVGAATVSASLVRFSAVPDAILIIALGPPAAAAWWFLKGFFTKAGEGAGEELGREVGRDLADAYRSFKARLRDVVTNRRQPADTPPITIFTLEVDRPGGGTVKVEGSTRATGADLDRFVDSGSDLLTVSSAYARLAPNPERLAKLHFTFEGDAWRFAYGVDDDAELVFVFVLPDAEHAQALEDAKRNAPDAPQRPRRDPSDA